MPQLALVQGPFSPLSVDSLEVVLVLDFEESLSKLGHRHPSQVSIVGERVPPRPPIKALLPHPLHRLGADARRHIRLVFFLPFLVYLL